MRQIILLIVEIGIDDTYFEKIVFSIGILWMYEKRYSAIMMDNNWKISYRFNEEGV